MDGYGRRSRPEDVKWTRLPLAFAYRAPYLYVLHFNSVEVMRLTPSSFMHKKPQQPATGDDASSTSSHESFTVPTSIFVELPSPRYLGPAPPTGTTSAGAVYFFTNNNESCEVVRLDGATALGEQDMIHPDNVSLSGSEFSITSSLVQTLDRSDDSTGTQGSSPVKRPQHQPHTANSKRVKFESDL